MSKLVSVSELAEILGMKESYIRSLVFKKEIPYLKIGHLIRFDLLEINAWLNMKKCMVLNAEAKL